MHSKLFLLASLLFTSTALSSIPIVSAQLAIAVIKPTTNSTVKGQVLIAHESEDLTMVSVDLEGLAPGARVGVHIHAFGDVSSPAATNAGGHYNPTNQSHGCPSFDNLATQQSIHVGDIGSIQADQSGAVSTTIGPFITISLDPWSPGFVIGRAVVVHAAADDCATQPTGNSGARLGQGVIGWGQATNYVNASEFMVDQPNNVVHAVAVLHPTDAFPKVSGQAYFTQEGYEHPIHIQASITGLEPNGIYGWHIHEIGDVSSGNASAVGSHWNPFGSEHGCPAPTKPDEHNQQQTNHYDGPTPSTPRHAGDLGNIHADSNGVALIDTVIHDGPLNLFIGGQDRTAFAIGRALIIHAAEDNCRNITSAGQRMAQGVIGYRNASVPLNLNAPAAGASTVGAKSEKLQGGAADSGATGLASSSWMMAGLMAA
ncbi:hypothetical protein HK102_009759, partial [Quaeritorhiza haematococci]